MTRRPGIPPRVAKRERALRDAVVALESRFPGEAILLLIADFGPGTSSYISNVRREDAIQLLREQLARFEMGTDDTLGREA